MNGASSLIPINQQPQDQFGKKSVQDEDEPSDGVSSIGPTKFGMNKATKSSGRREDVSADDGNFLSDEEGFAHDSIRGGTIRISRTADQSVKNRKKVGNQSNSNSLAVREGPTDGVDDDADMMSETEDKVVANIRGDTQISLPE